MRQVSLVFITHIIVYGMHVFPAIDGGLSLFFSLMAIVTQATLLCLPLFVLAKVSSLTSTNRFVLSATYLTKFLLPLAGTAMMVLLYVNCSLYGMYGFYIDPFVLNLITTPGGTDALGASDSFYLTAASIIILILLLYLVLGRLVPFERLFLMPSRWPKVAVAVALGIASIQATAFAVSEYKSYVPILAVSDRIPWYVQVTAKSTLEDLGVERSRKVMDIGKAHGSGFYYPESMPDILPLDKPYNIVWLVAESWRWDMLNPEIMPETWDFAKKSHQFLNHYSTGNGTRMGIFGQFYGLNGRFWFPALKYQRSPLLLDVLQGSDYHIEAYTSASFTYPEFDKTVWVNVEDDNLHSYEKGEGWERDNKNVNDLLATVNVAEKPFFRFMFFETTHANYDFPKGSEIRTDYLDDFDYLATDIEESIGLIKNRYINASSYLDSQFGKILHTLEEQGHLEDTIVIITGDHGEEFMENGRWGHNSTFSQQQIRVPLVIYAPGQQGHVVDVMTSHMDIPATVFSLLKPGYDSRQYSMGADLFSPSYKRNFSVVSDWHGDALVTEHYKFSMSPKSNAKAQSISTQNDVPLEDEGLPREVSTALAAYVSDKILFNKPRARPARDEPLGGLPGHRIASHPEGGQH